MRKNLKIIRLKGAEIALLIADLARLRITIFRDYPYLYDGDMEYEKKYLQVYVEHSSANIVFVFDGDKVVGASTSIPLLDEVEAFQTPFQNANMDIKKIFYFGESLLLPEYRGNGVYSAFFTEREAAARENGCSIAAFCAVERPATHPSRPANWLPLDDVWQKFGYQKHPEINTTFAWKDVDEDSESMKPMIFWIKEL